MGAVVLSRRRLEKLPEGLQRRVLRLAVRRLLGDLRELQGDHVEALLAGLAAWRRLSLWTCPAASASTWATRRRHLSLEQEEGAPALSTASEAAPEAPLTVPGVTAWGPWLVEAEVSAEQGSLPADPWRAWLDADVTGDELRVRSRRPGDRFQPLGLAGEKKLQDFFVDARVPRAQRDAVPLVCGRPGIVWVVGHRIDGRARVTEATRRVLRLRFRRGGGTLVCKFRQGPTLPSVRSGD